MMADSGDKVAKVYVMILHHVGTSVVPKNLAVAAGIALVLMPWLKAASNNIHALYGLGQCFALGCVVETDWVVAGYLFKLAADKGHPGAQNELGIRSEVEVINDQKEYYTWYKLSAKKQGGKAKGSEFTNPL
jgi:TPR repeat protein